MHVSHYQQKSCSWVSTRGLIRLQDASAHHQLTPPKIQFKRLPALLKRLGAEYYTANVLVPLWVCERESVPRVVASSRQDDFELAPSWTLPDPCQCPIVIANEARLGTKGYFSSHTDNGKSAFHKCSVITFYWQEEPTLKNTASSSARFTFLIRTHLFTIIYLPPPPQW